MEFFNDAAQMLFGTQKLYWFLAVVGTTLFLLQVVLSMFGAGAGASDLEMTDSNGDGYVDGHHADSGLAEFKLLSIRTLTAFITFFGWGGVFWGELGNYWGGFFISVGLGFAMMCVTASLLYLMLRLAESGTIRDDDIIGKSGSVYIHIPGGRSSAGKVCVSMESCTREISAVADEPLKTGDSVKVVGKIDHQHFLVERIG